MNKMDRVLEKMANEPNYHVFAHNGLICEIVRHPKHGHYCGYVLVPKDHPSYGKGYNYITDIDVHGGLTYADNRGDYWALGFDCSHGGDFNIPPDKTLREVYNKVYGTLRDGEYRDFEYVKGECKILADGLTGGKIDDVEAVIAKMILARE